MMRTNLTARKCHQSAALTIQSKLLLNLLALANSLGVARRQRCAGMNVQPVQAFCNPQAQHWAFQATVYKSKVCRGFVGYGDADSSNAPLAQLLYRVAI